MTIFKDFPIIKSIYYEQTLHQHFAKGDFEGRNVFCSLSNIWKLILDVFLSSKLRKGDLCFQKHILWILKIILLNGGGGVQSGGYYNITDNDDFWATWMIIEFLIQWLKHITVAGKLWNVGNCFFFIFSEEEEGGDFTGTNSAGNNNFMRNISFNFR